MQHFRRATVRRGLQVDDAAQLLAARAKTTRGRD
jgi:hypothetical protein